jgi:hypothetical protein
MSSIVVGQAKKKPVTAPSASDVTEVVSNPDSRKALSVTIYNNDIGLIRDKRSVSLPRAGTSKIVWNEVAPQIIAPSVAVSFHGLRQPVRMLEQTYRYDILSPQGLGQRADGTTISLHRTNPKSGELEALKGQLMGPLDNAPILRTSDGISFYQRYDAIGFERLPDRWSSRPSLNWLIDSAQSGDLEVDASYLSRGLTWEAEYVLSLARQPADSSSIIGWITLTNSSGQAFENAHIAVVAGKVNVVEPVAMDGKQYDYPMAAASMAPAPPPPAERSQLGEYYLYDIPGSTSLPQQSSKQVMFLSSGSLHPEKKYLANMHWSWRDTRLDTGASVTEPASVEYRFDVSEKQGLGVPMPSGTIRVLAPDSRGQLQYVGEEHIEHTPRDETIKLRIGTVSDILINRVLTSRTRLGSLRKDKVRYTVRNATSESVMIRVLEYTNRLDKASIASTQPEAGSVAYDVSVSPGVPVSWDAEYTEERW